MSRCGSGGSDDEVAMTRAALSIGSNLGDRWQTLVDAVAEFADVVTAVSAVYETAPWGPVPQGDYLNAVLLVDDPAAGPAEWLERAHQAERAAGRTRGVRFGPRTLDVDVIVVDDIRSDDPVLTLPHPRAAERAFVLVPWLDVDPSAALPGRGPVVDAVAGEVAGVRRRDDLAPLRRPDSS
jgi:2-amino-4-hydroxy-6-hydroxymethyldihydropteridine diphosphokinase